MTLDWILNPMTQYAAVGAGLVGSLTLWAMAQMDLRTCQKKMEAFRATTESKVQGLADDMNALRTAPAVAADQAPAGVLTQSLNLTRRTQVLRMHRRGEPVTSIAGALGIPYGEVELLLKLDKFLEGHPK